MNPTRRQMLKGAAAAAAAFTVVPRHVLGGPKFVAPSEKVNIAIIGCGGQGRHNLRALFEEPDAQVIALADPTPFFSLEKFYYKGVGGRLPVKAETEKHYQAKTPNFKVNDYIDFREMLEKEKSIDAIVCATPDHLHAYVCSIVMRQGKHVFCEKPLTHNIFEARYLAKLAKETGVATQLGNMGHSAEGIRQTIEYLRDGAIGTCRESYSWVGTSRWNPELRGLPVETPPLPEGVNWDLWIGPRQPRPYHPCYLPVAWRDFWAFGSGVLGDFGCHDLDAAVWAFDLHHPTSVEMFPAGYMDKEVVPYGELGYFHFPASEKYPAFKITWMAGGMRPPRPEALRADMNLPDRGVLFVGEKGIILCDGAGGPPRLFPDALRAGYKAPAKTLPRSKGHRRDWLDCIKGGPQASASFEYGARITEISLLGALSLRTRKRILWDAAAMKATGCPEADPFINEPVRKGWELA